MPNHAPRNPGFRSAVLLAVFSCGCPGFLAGQSLHDQMALAVQLAEERYEYLASSRLGSDKERFVNYTTTSGTWRTQNDSTWTSGFLCGNFWHLYGLTGNAKWAGYAAHWDAGVRSRATATDNDTGFQILDSFGSGIDYAPSIVDRTDYTTVILTGAATMTNQRYNATIGAYRAWPQGESSPDTMPFEVNIDMLMNMELVLWAAAHGGPQAYVDYAIAHADTSWTDLVRPDGSTFHVVEYNSSGGVVLKRTHQGWTRDSTWSRGQAWAVYGYTMMYRYTGLPRMLERAEVCFDYFVAATDSQATDGIPYSDFDAPLNSSNPRDSSAAAIVASAALELYTLTDDSKYLDRVQLILESLTSLPYLNAASSYESLLEKASEKWGESEVGAVFADFYLLEAMVRYYDWIPADPGTWHGYPVQPGYIVRTGPWLGDLYVEYAPWIYRYQNAGWIYLPDDGNPNDGGDWMYFPKAVMP